MNKIFICTIVVVIGFSSCRPSYMRCPKNRRCEVTPRLNQQQLVINNLDINSKKTTTSF